MSALPATMTCVEIKKPGGPEALVSTTRPVPQPKDGEILIKVAAAGVNRPDIAQRAGLYPPPPGASDLPGLEAAGTVAALGAGVTGWQVGDALCALTPGSAYAEYCTAPAPQCLPGRPASATNPSARPGLESRKMISATINVCCWAMVAPPRAMPGPIAACARSTGAMLPRCR